MADHPNTLRNLNTIQNPNTIRNPNTIDHPKTEHVRYSSPHCSDIPMIIYDVTAKGKLNNNKTLHQNNDSTHNLQVILFKTLMTQCPPSANHLNYLVELS